MLKNGLIDIDSIEYNFADEYDFIEMSKTSSNTIHRIGQLIKYESDKKLQRIDFFSFIFENIHLFLMILSTYLIVILISCLLLSFSSASHRFHFKKSFSILKLFFLDFNGLLNVSFKIYMLFLFFYVSNSILINLVGNCIKTDKISIDTHEIIDSFEKFKTTEKIFIMHSHDILEDKIFNGSFLEKFISRKSQENKFVYWNDLDNYIKNNQIDDLSQFFILESKNPILRSLKRLSHLSAKYKYVGFTKTENYYESLLTVIMRKSLDQFKKNKIHFRYESFHLINLIIIHLSDFLSHKIRINSYFESGSFNKLGDVFYSLVKGLVKDFNYFISIENYIEFASSNSNASDEFKIDYYKTVFICLLIFYLSIFSFFVIHCFFCHYKNMLIFLKTLMYISVNFYRFIINLL